MINIGSSIHGYTVQAMANDVALGYAFAALAPAPYVVYRLTDDCCGIRSGEYFDNLTDAEWEFCSRAFGWFEDNAPVDIIEDEVTDHIQAARESIAKATAMVDELIAMFSEEKAAPQEEIAEQNNIEKMLNYLEDFDFEKLVEIQSSVSSWLSKKRSSSS